jgi:hypothetical protein
VALKGYISPTTYVNITNIIYEKDMQRCTAVLSIYKDEFKKILLGNVSVTVEGQLTAPSVESVIELHSAPPANPSNRFYLVGSNAEREWGGCEGRLARLNDLGEWNTWVPTNNSWLLFAEDEEKYVEYVDGQWVERKDVLSDSRIWNKYLAPNVALSNNTNPSQQMYKIIKLLTEFKDCEDV